MDPATRLALISAAASTLDGAAGLVRVETTTTAPQIDPVVQQLLTSVEHMLSLLSPTPPPTPTPTAQPARRP